MYKCSLSLLLDVKKGLEFKMVLKPSLCTVKEGLVLENLKGKTRCKLLCIHI